MSLPEQLMLLCNLLYTRGNLVKVLMTLVGHRGAAGLAPENSLKAIKAARSIGVDAIELDIRVTKDNALVLCHDHTLKRLANIPTEVGKKPLSYLKEIKLSSGEYLASLSEALEQAEDTALIIEGKGIGWAVPLAQLIKHYPYRNLLKVTSFNMAELKMFKEICPDIKVYMLGHINIMRTIRIATNHNFHGIYVRYMILNPLMYKLTKKYNLNVIVYTVNSKILANLINKLYPKVAITTDVPHKLKHLVKAVNH